MTHTVHARPAVVGLMIAALVGALLTAVGLPTATADAAGDGGDYVPLSRSARVWDTRVPGSAPLGADEERAFTVLGVGGVPAAGVQAVSAVVTVADPQGNTELTLWADGTDRPVGSSMTVTTPASTTTAVVPVGADGKLRIHNRYQATDVIVDVQGWFTSRTRANGPGGFVPLPHTRVYDSATDGGDIPAGGRRTVNLARSGVPAKATAVFAALQVAGATSAGTLTLTAGTSTTGGHEVAFRDGTSSTGAPIDLRNGQATVHNRSKVPVHVMIDVQGWFSPAAREGAGFRAPPSPTENRELWLGGGSAETQVAGFAGVPRRGVAGVLLRVRLTAGEAPSAVSIRPTGTETGDPAVVAAGGPGDVSSVLTVVRPGRDGLVTLQKVDDPANPSFFGVLVTIEGWFAVPGAAELPVEPHSRPAVLQPSGVPVDGEYPIDLAQVDDLGVLTHIRTSADNVNDRHPTTLSDTNDTVFTGTPAMAEQADGRLTIAAQRADGTVWIKTETSRTPVAWPSGWTKLAGAVAAGPTLGTLADGRLVVLAVDAAGDLLASAQAAPNGTWPAWTRLGGGDLAGPPAVATTVGSPLEIFVRSSSGAIRTIAYGASSGWSDLGDPGTAPDRTGTPAVVTSPSATWVFVRTATGAVAGLHREADGDWPTTWETLPGTNAAGAVAAVLDPTLSTVQVFARNPEGHLGWIAETEPGSGAWTSWWEILLELDSDFTAATWVSTNGVAVGGSYTTPDGIAALINATSAGSPPLP